MMYGSEEGPTLSRPNSGSRSGTVNMESTESIERENTVYWNGPSDSRNPVNWSSSKKWTLMLFASLVMFAVEINATSITSAASLINDNFNVSDADFPNSYWPVTSWTLAGAIFPIILTPIIEDHGTRKGFLIVYTIFAISVIPQAVAPNFATLIVTRAFSGACGSTIAALVDGLAADLWTDEGSRGRAVTVYTFFLLGGYTVGPAVGGAIISTLVWRWIFYIQLIIYFSLLPFLVLVLRETRGAVILTQMARENRRIRPDWRCYSPAEKSSSSTVGDLKEGLIRPTQLLCTEPVLASFTLWSSFTLGMIFTFTQSIPLVYSALYSWSDSSTGIIQIAVFAGQAIGLVACWVANDVYMLRQNSTTSTPPTPEARLHLSIPATLLALAGGFFVYAWTSHPNMPWIAPTVGLAMVGFGSMCVVTAVDIYITDSYAKYAGSAIAAVTFGENTVSAFLPLATKRMYDGLGFQWAGSLLGFVALVLGIAPVVLVWKGEGIRARSRFMKASGRMEGVRETKGEAAGDGVDTGGAEDDIGSSTRTLVPDEDNFQGRSDEDVKDSKDFLKK